MSGAEILFFILAGLLIVCSCLVVLQRNIIYSAIALVAALLITAVFFITLHAPMIGILQVLVYAGAIMVLFLFVIMFLSPGAETERRGLSWALGALAGLLLTGALVPVLFEREPPRDPTAATELFGSPEQVARSMFSDFILPFEITSVLLLVAMIGAVVLAKRER